MRLLLITIILLLPFQSWSNVYFDDDVERGWYWYEDPEDKKKDEIRKEDKAKSEVVFIEPKTMKEAQEQLIVLKERAIMDQTDSSIIAYIRMQDWVHVKSETFAKKWKEVLYENPGLDYSLDNPTNSRAVLLKRDVKAKEINKKLLEISDKYGLFFVFRSDCPFCHKMSPILKSFAKRHNFSVFPISQDGVGLPEYPNPRRDNGLSKEMNITRVPALFLVNPRKRDIIPVSFGLLSETELSTRLVMIMEMLGEKK